MVRPRVVSYLVSCSNVIQLRTSLSVAGVAENTRRSTLKIAFYDFSQIYINSMVSVLKNSTKVGLLMICII